MTRWFGYFKEGEKEPYCRLVAAKDLTVAHEMAEALADRDEAECIGVIVAPKSFQ